MHAISYCHFCKDKIVRPTSMRATSSVYVNINNQSFLSVWDYKTKTQIAIRQKCRDFKWNKENSVSSVFATLSQRIKSKLTFQWTWGRPSLPVRSRHSLRNVEKRLFDFQTSLNALCLQTVVLHSDSEITIHMLLQNKTVTTQGYEISFPVFALSYDKIYTLLHWRTGSGRCNDGRINTAAYVLCYKWCYLLSLLWEVDLWLSAFNEC